MNLTELKQLAENYMEEHNTTFVGDLDLMILMAEDRIFHEVDLPVFIKNATASTSLNDKYLQLPTGYLSTKELSITVSGSQTFLLQKDVSFIREAYPNPTTNSGVPRFYAQFDDNTLLLAPTPDAVYPVELHYFCKPDSITTASTSWLGTNAPRTLLYATLCEAYTYMKGEPDLLQHYDRMYKESLTRIKLLGAGRMRTDNYRTPAQETAGV